MTERTHNGVVAEWMIDAATDDDEHEPEPHPEGSRPSDNGPGAAGCIFLAAILAGCVALAWLLTQTTGGMW